VGWRQPPVNGVEVESIRPDNPFATDLFAE
jgi:hypothetical protein